MVDRFADFGYLGNNDLVKSDVGEHVEASVSDVDASTRERVMSWIMEKGTATATDLALYLELTPAAVRRHLAALTAKGLISTRDRPNHGPRGRGRPAKVYVATDAGRAEFSQAYDTLAIEVLEHLRRIGGEEAVASFAKERFSRIEVRYRELMSATPGLSESEALAQVLSEDGFMAALLPIHTGEQLCQHHCPVAAVASRFPELCAAETEVFGRLLHSHVQRLATIAHGDGVCTTHIPFPVMIEEKPS